jgi:dienelactone hydrolase/DNA-directed RNA polymerase subunit RPC12/RpoP
MAISFVCEGCGKDYTVRDELAGKTGQCKQCGQRMLIPWDRDDDGYGVEAPRPSASPRPRPGPEVIADSAMLPPRNTGWATRPASELGSRKPSPLTASSPPGWDSEPKKRGFFGFGNTEKGGIAAGAFVVVMIVLRVISSLDNGQRRNAPNNGQPNAGVVRNNGRGGRQANAPVVDRSGPIRLPRFADRSPGREIEPGVLFSEIRLGPPRTPPGTPPGFGGKLWLYLPAGEHPAKSLPCILITGAGSTLQSGMDLVDEDRPEHLPYVRAGFAVLAFELDGVPQNKQQRPSSQEMFQFLNARAGLVNAHIALEYVLAKVPEVDPQRISAAGHSSAATLAVLFAEHEPRLKACVAYAPALDLEERFGPVRVNLLKSVGAGDLATRYSPKNNEDKLRVPLFLFHALDDSNIPFAMTEAFASDLKAKGKPVTLDLVPSGDHYDSMLNEGIPHGIAWLNEQGAGPGPGK